MAWKFLFVSGFKPHYCHPNLYEDLKHDLLTRQDAPDDVEVDETLSGRSDENAWCDLGGFVFSNEPDYSASCGDGNVWETRARCFDHYLGVLDALELRRFASGKEYYKIHGWMQCVVLTPSQRDALLGQMHLDAHDVHQRLDEFYKLVERICASAIF